MSAEDWLALMQGTLDLLILRTLPVGRAHGHPIAKAIERNSEYVLQVEQGSLYPALRRLSREAGLRRRKALPRTIAAQSITGSRAKAASSFR
jgi:DNA-binding PadR family transcriptional regulator